MAEHCREMAIVDGGFVDIEAWSLDAVAAVAPMACFAHSLAFAGAVCAELSPGASGAGCFIVGVVLAIFGRTSSALLLQGWGLELGFPLVCAGTGPKDREK